ncbi:MAG TPA: UDP-3-O-acyl-N-acetylglucosamine deacetylase [Candidatus Krumholzibacteria bacterium]|nr:UDP-3-O-acyl-N-acetylglucosamine deacetylase [Candidatus Krumholzibacteria bacterium]HRX50468.1 UDP-3-O-acyl-N-acetylglucosamine deacetylase [Candidatus Krumholzibacteria bacterium]
MLILQKTVGKRVEMSGTGLHTGEAATIAFAPAPVNTGLVFRVRRDGAWVDVPAVVENVPADHGGQRNTTLSAGGVEIHTVEHALSALYGMGVTNCYVELDGCEPPEPPSGSTSPYVELLDAAGIVEQGLPAGHYRVPLPMEFREGDVMLRAEPSDRFLVTFRIDYPDPLIGKQEITVEITPRTYREVIAPCRTFALRRDVEKLQAMGLVRGGSLDNALVVDDGKLLNDGELRFPDEFVRHKVLDLLGDVALLGMPIQGHLTAERSGHDTNVAFTRLLARSERRQSRIYPPRKPQHWDISSIMKAMPHRYPFLLVDRILELEPGRRVSGLKNVTINEPFFQGHFPGHPIMPAVLITEAMAQVGGVLLMSSVDEPASKLVYFSGIDGARFRRPVVPGDQLRFELEMLKIRGPICKMKGVARVDGELVAEAELMSTIVDR